MKLFLLRHAKTEKGGKNQLDFDRDLLEKGRKQCKVLSAYFKSEKFDFETVYCSTSKRTQRTYELIADSLPDHDLVLNDSLYLPSRAEMMKFLWELEGGEDMLVIGHNNAISDLAMYFLDEPLMLSTGGLVILEFPFEIWTECSKGTATCFDLFLPQVS